MIQTIAIGLHRKKEDLVFGPDGKVQSRKVAERGLVFTRSDTPNHSYIGTLGFGELGRRLNLGNNAIVAVEVSNNDVLARLIARAESSTPGRNTEQFTGPMGLGIVTQGDQWEAIVNVSSGTNARVTPGEAAGMGSVVINSSAEELVIDFK